MTNKMNSKQIEPNSENTAQGEKSKSPKSMEQVNRISRTNHTQFNGIPVLTEILQKKYSSQLMVSVITKSNDKQTTTN